MYEMSLLTLNNLTQHQDQIIMLFCHDQTSKSWVVNRFNSYQQIKLYTPTPWNYIFI